MLLDAIRRGRPASARSQRTAASWRLARQAIHRLTWGLADQMVSSLTNAAVSIYVVRTLGAVQFGAFSLAYVTYAFALNASRGLSTDPLMVRFSGTNLRTWRRAVKNCTGTATVVGVAAGACVLGVAAVLDGTARGAFLALGLMLPGLMLQDSWRYAFFALGRGSLAFLNDLVWALVLLPALVFLRVTGHANVFSFVLVWGASAAVAAAIGPLQARVVPRLSGAWRWMSDHRDLGPRYLAEGTSNSASTQLRTYGIGLILGLATVGYVAAASTLVGPMTIVFLGMSLVTIPEGARVLRRSPRHLLWFCLLVSGGLAAAALAWGIVLAVALPRGLGSWLLGPDLAADISAGAASDALYDWPGRLRRGRHGPARAGIRAAKPSRDGARISLRARVQPGGRGGRRRHGYAMGPRRFDVGYHTAVVVATARSSPGGRHRGRPGLAQAAPTGGATSHAGGSAIPAAATWFISMDTPDRPHPGPLRL